MRAPCAVTVNVCTASTGSDGAGTLDCDYRGGVGHRFWDSDVFLHILFLDYHNFINNHPPDLKLVSNDAACNLLHALKIGL
jgi:hypothetical protein